MVFFLFNISRKWAIELASRESAFYWKQSMLSQLEKSSCPNSSVYFLLENDEIQIKCSQTRVGWSLSSFLRGTIRLGNYPLPSQRQHLGGTTHHDGMVTGWRGSVEGLRVCTVFWYLRHVRLAGIIWMFPETRRIKGWDSSSCERVVWV